MIQKLSTTHKMQTIQNTAKQNYPGLAESYNTRPGIEVDLFYKDLGWPWRVFYTLFALFWKQAPLFVTYLLYLQPPTTCYERFKEWCSILYCYL